MTWAVSGFIPTPRHLERNSLEAPGIPTGSRCQRNQRWLTKLLPQGNLQVLLHQPVTRGAEKPLRGDVTAALPTIPFHSHMLQFPWTLLFPENSLWKSFGKLLAVQNYSVLPRFIHHGPLFILFYFFFGGDDIKFFFNF